MDREKAQSWRVFCAIELPDDARARLQEHIARLRKEFLDAAASWSRVENIHLTLKFFGNVELEGIPKISAAATRTAGQFSKFQIEVAKTGVFPRPSRAQVLWIGISDPSNKLTALQETFETECAAEGFSKEDRAYRPHLTIARIRKPKSARRLADAHLNLNFPSITVILNELIVVRSEPSSKGSRYTSISSHPLPNP